jgi:hypothetical protein
MELKNSLQDPIPRAKLSGTNGLSQRFCQLYLEGGEYRQKNRTTAQRFHFLFLRFKSVSSFSPLKRSRNSFTSSRNMLISLSKALAFVSAIFLSSSISSSRFPRSASNALICSTVLFILLIVVLPVTSESVTVST